MERCPVCRARFKGETTCYRCGADLTVLLHIETLAHQRQRIAFQQLMQGDFQGAEWAARAALQWQQEPLTQALLGFIQQLAKRPRLSLGPTATNHSN